MIEPVNYNKQLIIKLNFSKWITLLVYVFLDVKERFLKGQKKFPSPNFNLNSTLCYNSLGQQITRGENGRPPEKHTILFFRPIIVNIIIVKKLWLGKKIVQW